MCWSTVLGSHCASGHSGCPTVSSRAAEHVAQPAQAADQTPVGVRPADALVMAEHLAVREQGRAKRRRERCGVVAAVQARQPGVDRGQSVTSGDGVVGGVGGAQAEPLDAPSMGLPGMGFEPSRVLLLVRRVVNPQVTGEATWIRH